MQKQKPLVSIGFIAYNRDNVLPEAIKSLLTQSYKNFELIISDDASSDNTQKIGRAFAKKDKRVTFYRQVHNIGMAKNQNFVLKKARGKYFMWACDDDRWDKNFVKEMVALLENNKKAVIAMSDFIEFNNTKKNIIHQFDSYSSKKSSLINYLNDPALLIYSLFRTKSLRKIGGFHQSNFFIKNWGSDHLTIVKTLLEGDLVFSKKLLFFKRDSGYSLSKNDVFKHKTFSKKIFVKIERNLLFFPTFLNDLIVSFRLIAKSRLSLKDKTRSWLYYLKYYLAINAEHLLNIIGVIKSVF